LAWGAEDVEEGGFFVCFGGVGEVGWEEEGFACREGDGGCGFGLAGFVEGEAEFSGEDVAELFVLVVVEWDDAALVEGDVGDHGVRADETAALEEGHGGVVREVGEGDFGGVGRSGHCRLVERWQMVSCKFGGG
jgi:hypothetical protein